MILLSAPTSVISTVMASSPHSMTLLTPLPMTITIIGSFTSLKALANDVRYLGYLFLKLTSPLLTVLLKSPGNSFLYLGSKLAKVSQYPGKHAQYEHNNRKYFSTTRLRSSTDFLIPDLSIQLIMSFGSPSSIISFKTDSTMLFLNSDVMIS